LKLDFLVKKSANKSSKYENNPTASQQSTKHLTNDNLTQNTNFGTVDRYSYKILIHSRPHPLHSESKPKINLNNKFTKQ